MSRHLSDLVASCCEQHHETIDAETFQIFTHKEYVPEVSFNAARKLLQLEHTIVRHDKQSTELTNLQARCLTAIKDNIAHIDFQDSNDKTIQILKTLPSATVVDLMIMIHTSSSQR